jgi:hypothetical protein
MLMARYPQNRRFAQKPPNRRQIQKRNNQYRRNFRENEKKRMKEALEDKHTVVMAQIEGHYLEIKNISGKVTQLIVPFCEAKKQLGSFIFYHANPSAFANLYYVIEIRQDEDGYWLILPHQWQAKLCPDDEKTLQILHQLLLGTSVVKEMRRLRRKRNCI